MTPACPRPRARFVAASHDRLLRAALLAASILTGCTDLAGPSPTSRQRFDVATTETPPGTLGEIIPNEYIIRLNAEQSDVPGLARQLVAQSRGELKYTYQAALTAFAARIPGNAIEAIRRNPLVAAIEQNRIVQSTENQAAPPSWGLDRIDQATLPLSGTYAYGPTGAGVNAYIIDSGIRLTHYEIAGRAFAAFSSVPDSIGSDDCSGHGTHVAGTVGGTTVGVAKSVKLYAVRVLNCTGGGTLAGVIAGIDWVAANRVLPAVANMSLGGSSSSSLNQAVANTVAKGVTVVVSAGNMTTSACFYSPANEVTAITVAATDMTDAQASYSNYGECVDIYAPGTGIVSLDIWGDSAYRTRSGTSMASPHVAGAAALYLEANPSASPAQVASALVGAATKRVLLGIDRTSPNALLYVGNLGSAPDPIPTPEPPPGTDQPPTASFNANCSRWRCNFDATSSTDDKGIASYAWSFGDGFVSSASSGAVVTHSYAVAGTFTVTLTVTDASGQSARVQKSVKVRKV